MKTALITTTINVPHVLSLYRKYGPDVAFFVAGDQKSPHEAICELAATRINGDFLYMSPDFQRDWKCSEPIGWNCIQRRNIALLEALKWGADVIVTVDDDNIPLDSNYFEDFISKFYWAYHPIRAGHTVHLAEDKKDFDGLKASSPDGWFDVGQLLQPVSPHRGFPHTKTAQPHFEHITDAKVGVAAGICLGDPDISAVTRIARGPVVHGISEILRSGVVTDPAKTWTVFNTQNTAFIRELAPAMFCPPGIGRYDDIFASLICQRVMRERGLHVHFGKPFVWQQRNTHNLAKDLEAELFGMLTIEQFSKYLSSVTLKSGTVLDHLRQIITGLNNLPNSYNLLPDKSIAAYRAWLDDVETVL